MRTTDALQSGLSLLDGVIYVPVGQGKHRITGGRKCIGIYVPVGRGKHDGMGLLEGTAGRE